MASRCSARLTMVFAAGTLFALGSCSEPTAPPPPPPSPLTVSFTADSVLLIAVRERQGLAAIVTVRRDATPLAAPLNWWVLNDSVARVDQAGIVTARRGGTTTLYANSDSGGLDSVRIVVQQRAASVEVVPAGPTIVKQRMRPALAIVRDSAGVQIPGAAVLWSVSDAAVLSVDAAGAVTGIEVGTADVVARTGAIGGQSPVTVLPLPRLHFAQDTVVLGPRFRTWDRLTLAPDSTVPFEPLIVTLSSDDGTVAWPTPEVDHPYGVAGERRLFLSAGVPGSTVIRASAPGYEPTEVPVIVSRGKLSLPDSVIVSSNWFFEFRVLFQDSLGVGAAIGGPLPISLASSDLGVAAPVSPISAVGSVATVHVSTRQPGTALLVVSAPDFLPETVVVEVRTPVPLPREVFIGDASPRLATATLGRTSSDYVQIRAGGVDTMLDTVVFAITVTGGGALSLGATAHVAGPGRVSGVEVTAMTYGTDTLVVSSAGLRPDTLIIEVVPPRMSVAYVPEIAYVRSTFRPAIYIDNVPPAIGTRIGLRTVVRVTSSDPTVLAVMDTLVTFEPGNYIYQAGNSWIMPVGIGSATLTFADTAGIHASVTTDPIIVQRRRLEFAPQVGATSFLSVGMRQAFSTEIPAFPLGWFTIPGGTGDGHPVDLRILDPAIATVSPSSMNSSAEIRFQLVGGDVAGTARLVGGGPDLLPDTTEVVVSRPTTLFNIARIEISRSDPRAPYGFGLTFRITDAYGNWRVPTENVTFEIASTDTSVFKVIPAQVTVAAGSWESPVILLSPRSVGIAAIRVRDPRSTPWAYSTSVTYVKVDP